MVGRGQTHTVVLDNLSTCQTPTIAWPRCAGGKRLLRPDGILFLYGPFMIGGRHTATTNAAFDADLKQRDPRWGVRDVDDIVREAMPNGLALREVVEMPANNLSLVLVKSSCLRLRTVAPAAPDRHSILLIARSSNPYALPPFVLRHRPVRDVRHLRAQPRPEGTKNNTTRLPMNTKITLELTPEQIRFLRYVAELEGLTVEQYLLRFAKGQIVHPINSQKS